MLQDVLRRVAAGEKPQIDCAALTGMTTEELLLWRRCHRMKLTGAVDESDLQFMVDVATGRIRLPPGCELR